MDETGSKTTPEKTSNARWDGNIDTMPPATVNQHNKSSFRMVLVSPNEAAVQPLAKALLQVVSTRPAYGFDPTTNNYMNAMEQKIVGALARALSDQRPEKLRPHHSIHVMESLISGNSNQLVSNADHIVIALSASDIQSMVTSSATATRISRRAPVLLDHHPLVQQTLKALKHSRDSILMQRISIVALFRQDEDDPIALSSIAATKNKKSSTAAIPIFLCRPDQTSSCQAVAQMLWKRLKIGQRTTWANPILLT